MPETQPRQLSTQHQGHGMSRANNMMFGDTYSGARKVPGVWIHPELCGESVTAAVRGSPIAEC